MSSSVFSSQSTSISSSTASISSSAASISISSSTASISSSTSSSASSTFTSSSTSSTPKPSSSSGVDKAVEHSSGTQGFISDIEHSSSEKQSYSDQEILNIEHDRIIKQIKFRNAKPTPKDLVYRQVKDRVKFLRDKINKCYGARIDARTAIKNEAQKFLGIEEKKDNNTSADVRRYRPVGAAEKEYKQIIELYYAKVNLMMSELSEQMRGVIDDVKLTMKNLMDSVTQVELEIKNYEEEVGILNKQESDLYNDSLDALVVYANTLEYKINNSIEEAKKLEEKKAKMSRIKELENAAEIIMSMSVIDEKDYLVNRDKFIAEKKCNDEAFREMQMSRADLGVYRSETPITREETEKLMKNHECMCFISEDRNFGSSAYWTAYMNRADLVSRIAEENPGLYESVYGEDYIAKLRNYTNKTRVFVWSIGECRVIVLERDSSTRLWVQYIYYVVSTIEQARDNVESFFSASMKSVDLGSINKGSVIC